MRIGILTFHDADNFGCVFQCFGLQEAVKKLNSEAEVEIINFKRVRPGADDESKPVDEEVSVRASKFKAFRDEYMNISKEDYASLEDLPVDRYDLCIVGSDQVWNYNLVFGREKAYFLQFAGAKTRKISYAASIGSVYDDPNKMEWLRAQLCGMDAISLRERSVFDGVQALTDKHVNICIDPSLLHDRTFWEKYEKKPEKLGSEKYVLMYALGYGWCRDNERKAAEMASKVAVSKGINVIHYYYGKLREWLPDGSEHCFCEGPQELLWLFHHAEYVICCSFHGTAFSLIYERPFYTFHTPGNGSRMKDLVEYLGLPDRYIDEDLPEENWNWDIPWGDVENRLLHFRGESLDYLSKEIELI